MSYLKQSIGTGFSADIGDGLLPHSVTTEGHWYGNKRSLEWCFPAMVKISVMVETSRIMLDCKENQLKVHGNNKHTFLITVKSFISVTRTMLLYEITDITNVSTLLIA